MTARTIDDFVNTIFVADSARLLPKIPGDSIDFVVTSPPYNLGMPYDVIDDSLDFGEYYGKIDVIWKECYRVLKKGGRLALNITPFCAGHVDTHHDMTEHLKRIGFKWRTEIIWDKGHYNSGVTKYGSYRLPSNNLIRFTHEYIIIFDKELRKKELDNPYGMKLYKEDKEKVLDMTKDQFIEWMGSAIWNIPSASGMNRDYGHHAVFPEEIPERLMKMFSFVGDLVLDPFNGIGTTSKVAVMNRRRFIGVDISDKYCRTALQRVLSYQRNTSLVDERDDYFPMAKLVVLK